MPDHCVHPGFLQRDRDLGVNDLLLYLRNPRHPRKRPLLTGSRNNTGQFKGALGRLVTFGHDHDGQKIDGREFELLVFLAIGLGRVVPLFAVGLIFFW
jgi:hypothetical protein